MSGWALAMLDRLLYKPVPKRQRPTQSKWRHPAHRVHVQAKHDNATAILAWPPTAPSQGTKRQTNPRGTPLRITNEEMLFLRAAEKDDIIPHQSPQIR
eukprot:5760232-Amphidinium_carterae.1